MDKKIVLLSFLLIVLVAITASYVYFYETADDKEAHGGSQLDIVTDDELFKEINDIFLDEEDEIDIGEMV